MDSYINYFNYDIINIIVNFLYPDELDIFIIYLNGTKKYVEISKKYKILKENRYKKIFHEQFLGFYEVFNDFNNFNKNIKYHFWDRCYKAMNESIPTIIKSEHYIMYFQNKHRKFLTYDQLFDMTGTLELPDILYKVFFYKEYLYYYIELENLNTLLKWKILYTLFKFVKDEKWDNYSDYKDPFQNLIKYTIEDSSFEKYRIFDIITKDSEIKKYLINNSDYIDVLIKILLNVKDSLK